MMPYRQQHVQLMEIREETMIMMNRPKTEPMVMEGLIETEEPRIEFSV